ncbi:MAG TPA: hypothetical protein VN541_11125 [Tepidisphaeraceae bacterium]|nr:hypothetical protein [Tepidisphaeraceae bacterium]
MPLSSKAYAVVLADAEGNRQFLSTLMGIVTAPTLKQGRFVLGEWKRISKRRGVNAKVVRVTITES